MQINISSQYCTKSFPPLQLGRKDVIKILTVEQQGISSLHNFFTLFLQNTHNYLVCRLCHSPPEVL